MTSHPQDISPFGYGAGLTLGLILLIGLPAESPRVVKAKDVARDPKRTIEQEKSEFAARTQQLIRERRAQTAASRP